MKILVSGSSGLLGQEVVRYCRDNGHVCDRLDRSRISWEVGNSVNRHLLLGYDVFIHCAANTNVEDCEKNAIQCYKDNTHLTEKLVIAAQGCEIKFVYISSTGIYGNQILDRPYTEYDIPEPSTVHHKSKYFGELCVKELSDHLIIRTGWLFGSVGGKSDFVRKIKLSAKTSGSQIKANSEQVGVPTFVPDVVSRLFDFFEVGEVGIFNLVSGGSASRFDYVKGIIDGFHLDISVTPCCASEFKRLAPVSNNESAINLKQEIAGYQPMRDWHEALKYYIKTITRG